MRLAKIGRARLSLIVFVIVLFAALFLYQEQEIAGAFGFPLDDAWIHCQFARNLALGNGMSYNPGVQSSGSTAPLWTLMLAPPYFFTSNVIFISKFISLVLYALSCVLVFKIIVFVLDDARFAFLGAILSAMISRLMFGALSGMEVMLSAFLTTAGVCTYLLYRRKKGMKRYACTVIFALASLARPESILLVFFALLDSFLLGRVEKEEKLFEFARRALIHLLLFLALLSPYFVFNYLAAGEPFPSTFAAKRGGGLVVLLSGGGIKELRKIIFLYPQLYLSESLDLAYRHNVLLYWFMFIGTGKIVIDSFRRKTRNRALIIPLVFFLYPVLVAVVSPSRTVLVLMERYMGNLIPLYVVLGVTGFHVTVSFLRSALAKFWIEEKKAGKLARAATMTGIVVLLVSLSIEEYEHSRFYAYAVQSINEMQVRIGRWMKENTPPDAVLAVADIGAIAYFSEREIIDLGGLITPEILPYRERDDGIFEFIALRKPDYVVIFPRWFPELLSRKELILLFPVTLEKNAVCGEPTKLVFKTIWADE